MDCMFHCAPDVWTLLRFGDIPLHQKFVSKLATLFEGVDWSTVPSFALGPYLAAIRGSSFHADIGASSSSLSLLETFSCSFDKVQGTFEFLNNALASAGVGWAVQNEHGSFGFMAATQELVATVKAAHCLHTPEKIASEARRAFLAAYADATPLTDTAFDCCGALPRADIARVMEAEGQHEAGIEQARWMLRSAPHTAMQSIEANRALGRCYAKLGRAAEAEAAFEAAVADAARVGSTYHEVLTRCDYVKSVLDAAGRRGEQLAPLGRAIQALVLEPAEYDSVLAGYGLDATAAVAAADADAK